MLRRIYFITIGLSLPYLLLSQCPPQGIPILADEVAVDSFLQIYPNCEEYKVGAWWNNGKRIYWIKQNPTAYLLTLLGILFVIHFLLFWLFKKYSWFHRV